MRAAAAGEHAQERRAASITRRGFLSTMLGAAGAAVARVGCAADGQVLLRPNQRYATLGGKQSFLLGRNPTGWREDQFEPIFAWSRESGERLARIHVTHGFGMGHSVGELDQAWAAKWDRVFDLAEGKGMCVIPVMAVWGDWNDGSRGEHWHNWERNPYNAALGGPASSPAELLRDSRCRRLWLRWLAALVARWSRRDNVLAWEAFSELDLVTGASEDLALDFMTAAAAVIRGADGAHRPVTASLAGVNEWPALFASDAVEIVQVHPYGMHLDTLIITSVRERLARYGKPVLIGESGLSAAPLKSPGHPLTSAPAAHIGVGHAIWAAVVSGAMNGRMLWWEDGYDQYAQLDVRTRYRHTSRPAARFARGVDFTGLGPLDVRPEGGVFGGALGDGETIIGWFRDAACTAPDWPMRQVRGASVSVRAPATAREGLVRFYSTTTGDFIQSGRAAVADGRATIPLPAFEGSIAFRVRLEGG